MNYIRWQILLLSATVAASPVAAADRPIGFALAAGNFQVDTSTVGESATIFDGSSVETSNVPAVLTFNNGTQFRLAAHSRLRVQGTRLLLEKGLGQISKSGTYELQARTLRVVAAAPNSVGRIGLLEDDDTVSVTTISGAFRVMNPAGAVVADVAAGTALNVVPQSPGAVAAQALTRVVGCVEKRDEDYFVKDEMSKMLVELVPVELVDVQTGEKTTFDLAEQIRKRVDITGQSTRSIGARAASTLTISTLKRLGSCRPLAAAWWPVIAGASTAAVVCGVNCPQPAALSR